MPATPLDREHYVSLESFKKDGTGVKTPVWAAALDGKLVMVTDGTSFKARRMRREPRVHLAGCDARGNVHGTWFEAEARFLTEPAEIDRATATLRRKYHVFWAVFAIWARFGGKVKERVVLELTVGKPVA